MSSLNLPAPHAPHRASPPRTRIVAIAASAGSLAPLIELLAALPENFPAPVLLVQHRSTNYPDLLPMILRGKITLPLRTARDGDPLLPATLYLCPPGMHMTAEHSLQIMDAPRLNFVKPSADLLFHSIAQTHGNCAIAVVLSGTGSDGAIGSRVIVAAGGTFIAQDPLTAQYRAMPDAAAMVGPAQLVLPPEAIGPALLRLVSAPLPKLRTQRPPAQPLDPIPKPPAVTRILLADDHQIIRDGLRTLLNNEPDMTVIGEAADGKTTVRLAAKLTPDLVVMDLAMPGTDGIAATRAIRARFPKIKVIMLSAQSDLHSTNAAVAAGAAGFLSKEKAFDQLIHAIRATQSPPTH